MQKCNQCGSDLLHENITNEEKEYHYNCRGEQYSELEDIPTERQDEAEYVEINILTYTCEKCGEETEVEIEIQ